MDNRTIEELSNTIKHIIFITFNKKPKDDTYNDIILSKFITNNDSIICHKIKTYQMKIGNNSISGIQYALVDFSGKSNQNKIDSTLRIWREIDLFNNNSRKFHVVTIEWLVQCIITGVHLDPDEHELFNPFYTHRKDNEYTFLRSIKGKNGEEKRTRYTQGDFVYYNDNSSSNERIGKIVKFHGNNGQVKLKKCIVKSKKYRKGESIR